jgi:hypothetical protein
MRIIWDAGNPATISTIHVPSECVTAKEPDMVTEHSQPPEKDDEPDWPGPAEPDGGCIISDELAPPVVTRTFQRKSVRRRIGE